MFIGREKEITSLNSFYEGEGRVAAVYGQPGMGKTALLREFAQELQPVYFTAYDTCDVQELELLARALGREKQASSLPELLDDITELSHQGQVLFIIDQYPAFAKADPSYEKILHDYIMHQWSGLPVKVILCGDSYLFMEKHVYGAKAIWRDVLALAMEVTGMDFFEARGFWGERDLKEAMFLYGMTGGIPALLRGIGDTIEETIRELYFSGKYAIYLPERIMSAELRELSYYNRLLTCLAQGYHRVNQLSEMVGKPKDVVVPYLNTLMSIGVVTKETPITEKTNRKKTRYSIVNSSYAFWYGAIVPCIDAYQRQEYDLILTKGVLPYKKELLENMLIRVTREYLLSGSSRRELPFTIEHIGNWWVNDEEKKTTEGFDLVATGTSQGKAAMIFVQCCYEDEPVEIAYLKGLIEKTKLVRKDQDVFYVISSKSGFHENALTVASAIKNIILLDTTNLG